MVKACDNDGEDRMLLEQFLCSLSMGKMKDRMLAQEYDLREQALMAAECEESTTVAINEIPESEISLNRRTELCCYCCKDMGHISTEYQC